MTCLLAGCGKNAPTGTVPEDSGTVPDPPKPIRTFTAVPLIADGSCTLCRDTFRATGFNNLDEIVGTMMTGSNTATFHLSGGVLTRFYTENYSFQHINDQGIVHGATAQGPAKFVNLQPVALQPALSPYVVNNLGHRCGKADAQTVCYVDGNERVLDFAFDNYSELSDTGLLVGWLGNRARIVNIATGDSKTFDLDSHAFSVNAQGQVVGEVLDSGIMKPFVFNQGVLTVLDVPATYKFGGATDINNNGEIVGVISYDALSGWHSPDTSQGGVAAGTVIDFFYCNASLACMHVAHNTEKYDFEKRVRINDKGTIVFAGDTDLTLYQ
jgi:hypothetical protein